MEKIKEIRQNLDQLSKLAHKTGGVSKFEPSENLKKVSKQLLFAKAWLGKCLGYMGNSTPYLNDGKRKSVKDIEPTDDETVCFVSDDWYEKDYVERIDIMRTMIKQNIGLVEEIMNDVPNKWLVNASVANAWTYLNNASMQCGFELQRLREEEYGSR